MTSDGIACADAVPFCANAPAVCGAPCDILRAVLEPACCPVPEGFCDLCEGRAVLEGVMLGDHSCMDTIGFCATNAPVCGGTCEELRASMGFMCCPAIVPTTTTTTTTATMRPTAQPSEYVNQTHKIVYIDPKLQHGTHVALLAGSWMIRAEGTYQARNSTTHEDIGVTTCDRPLVGNQAFTGWCTCNDYTYGKCMMSVFYNLGAPCPSSNNSCGNAVPADGRITTSRAGVVYFQIADTFYEDNNGSVILTMAKEDDGWRNRWSGAVTSAQAKMTMLLVMVVSLSC